MLYGKTPMHIKNIFCKEYMHTWTYAYVLYKNLLYYWKNKLKTKISCVIKHSIPIKLIKFPSFYPFKDTNYMHQNKAALYLRRRI